MKNIQNISFWIYLKIEVFSWENEKREESERLPFVVVVVVAFGFSSTEEGCTIKISMGPISLDVE